jgi:hypothetical protein
MDSCGSQNYVKLDKIDSPIPINIDDIENIDTCYLVIETPNDIIEYDFSSTSADSSF